MQAGKGYFFLDTQLLIHRYPAIAAVANPKSNRTDGSSTLVTGLSCDTASMGADTMYVAKKAVNLDIAIAFK